MVVGEWSAAQIGAGSGRAAALTVGAPAAATTG